MVDTKFLHEITEEVHKLCKKHGVVANLVAEQSYDDDCIVNIDEDTGRKYDDELAAIAEELTSMPGIADVYDAGKGMLRSDGYRAFEIKVKDGHWTHTDVDDKLIEEDMAQYFDDEVRERKEKERVAERHRNWKKHIIPIPTADKNATEEVYLVLSYEPFDWIKSGDKTTEFRSYTERYVKRLIANRPKRVRFQRGYGGPGRPKPEQMVFEIKGVTLYDINTKIETDPFDPKPIVPTHIAIELGKMLER